MTTAFLSPKTSIRKLNLLGCTAVVLGLGGVGGWASNTELAGAVIAESDTERANRHVALRLHKRDYDRRIYASG